MSRENLARRGHRIKRIERAVAEALEFELLPSLEDPTLGDLHVLTIEATNNFSAVHVVVAPGAGPAQDTNEMEVQAALDRAEGYLRTELAGILRIKRIPVLKLRYVPLPITSGSGAQFADGGDA